jgi:hypothetical protein
MLSKNVIAVVAFVNTLSMGFIYIYDFRHSGRVVMGLFGKTVPKTAGMEPKCNSDVNCYLMCSLRFVIL